MRATEARRHWRRLLDDVEKGETVTITRRGQVVARVVPAPASENASYRKAVERFCRRLQELEPVHMSIEEILSARHEGHRY